MKTSQITVTAIVFGIGTVVSNFAWQAVRSQDWATATERSFFQGAALSGFVLLLLMTKSGEQESR